MRRSAFSRLVLPLLALALVSPAAAPAAGELRPFVAGSMQTIRDAQRGKPFILALWSLACVHCREDLDLLGRLAKREPRLKIVLVSTDEPRDAEEIRAVLEHHGLSHAQSWVFADAMAERLRFEVDRRWRGELPRTYFFDRAHHPQAVSGPARPDFVVRWVEENRP